MHNLSTASDGTSDHGPAQTAVVVPSTRPGRYRAFLVSQVTEVTPETGNPSSQMMSITIQQRSTVQSPGQEDAPGSIPYAVQSCGFNVAANPGGSSIGMASSEFSGHSFFDVDWRTELVCTVDRAHSLTDGSYSATVLLFIEQA